MISVYPIVWWLVFAALGVTGLGCLATWNRTTIGHRLKWAAQGRRPTLQERLDARLHGVPAGHWDDDLDVMQHFPYAVAQRRAEEVERATIAARAAEAWIAAHPQDAPAVDVSEQPALEVVPAQDRGAA